MKLLVWVVDRSCEDRDARRSEAHISARRMDVRG